MDTAVLDTSVLIKLRGTKVSSAVEKIISEQLSDTELWVSEISCYEFLRSVSDKNDLDARQQFLQQWPRLMVNTDLLRVATYYYNVICRMKNAGGTTAFNLRQFSDCDILVGATAIQVNAYVCTTDGQDFPRPLFEEIFVEKLPTNNEKFYILKPDIELFMAETQKFVSKKGK